MQAVRCRPVRALLRPLPRPLYARSAPVRPARAHFFHFLNGKKARNYPLFPPRPPRTPAPALAVPCPPPLRAYLSVQPLLDPVRAKCAPMLPKLLRDQRRLGNHQ